MDLNHTTTLRRYGTMDSWNSSGSGDTVGWQNSSSMELGAAASDQFPKTSKVFNHGDYTVGWVCALSKEQTAAIAMLDDIHSSLSAPDKDGNSYTLGTILLHHVVITCLPEGEIGTNSAANVVTQMVNTFPSIKFCLMVGIGGGIPPKVRLGDVVVSKPTGQFPGVVQWDLGKAERNGFDRHGSLSRPPKALLTALTQLKTSHELRGPKIQKYLDELATNWPKLIRRYTRNNSFRDPVDEPDRTWVQVITWGLWGPMIDEDQPRPAEMRVHYGLIASGNQVVKNSKIRDKIDKDHGNEVLCIEMEAAGLMNNFPSLVIRGICDYADEGKNKVWQEHAAAVAAAYAKELLEYVRPDDVAKEHGEEMHVVRRGVSRINSNIDKEENRRVLDWLTPVNYGPQQSDYLKRRQSGTGQWLLQSIEFRNWLTTSKKTLYCSGIPGAGKTILTSIVIEELQARRDWSIGIAYIYFNFKRQNEQDIEDLFASVLKQLAAGQPSVPESLKNLYERHIVNGTRPSLDDIKEVLQSVAQMYSRVFIVVDALDECRSEYLNQFLRELFSIQMQHDVNIFATSRPIPEIMGQFKEKNSISREIRAVPSDVAMYLEGHMNLLPMIVHEDPELQNEIKIGISEAVDGMFLLAQIYLSLLADKMTKKKIRSELEVFRKRAQGKDDNQMIQVLTSAYQQAMERIQKQGTGLKSLAMRTLLWIACANSELTASQLLHALATESEGTKIDDDNIPHLGDVVRSCAGLVTVDEETDIIRLVHYTTQEYLEKTQNIWFAGQECTILNTCITYLSFAVFEQGFCTTDRSFEKRQRSYPFYSYAAKNWGHHVPKNMKVNTELIRFLKNQTKVEASSQALMAVKQYSFHSNYSQEVPTMVTGLHLAGYFGVRDAADALLQSGYSLNSMDSYGRTPLWLASQNGHEDVVRLLLDNEGAMLETRDTADACTPLIWAARNGHQGTVRVLLEKGANINAKGKDDRTSLSWAVWNGKEFVVQLLLNKGADVNTTDKAGRTPLSLAAFHAHNDIIQLLLTKDADIHENDEAGKIKLLAAGVQRKTVEQLVFRKRTGTDTTLFEAGLNQTASPDETNEDIERLFLAIENGEETVLQQLLDKGACVDILNQDGRTLLSLAAEKENEGMGILKLLLKANKVNIDAKDTEDGRTPLMCAVKTGNWAVSKLLLDAGANIEAKDDGGATPLVWAAESGKDAVVRLLIDAGANVKARDDDGNTPLFAAAGLGSKSVMQLLLDGGADANETNKDGRTPLFMAAGFGGETTVKLLLGTGVDIDARGHDGRTPLFFAATFGQMASIKLLIGKGADANARDGDGRTPLFSAIGTDDVTAVRSLLETGKADVNAADKNGRTPLSWAAEKGNEAIVRSLLETEKVDASVMDGDGRTPLLWATEGKHQGIAQLLRNTANHTKGLKRV
ncbi:Ankyrin repeat domain-containing protein 50 [Cladobotryum mycophilum]|uniref:Ankyrin repeat domain-containing protein 50 n=1 Tax=Cladobotryum mycophilum TaxID=491253 RepID=A0ABR0STX4_9HYPO